MQTFGVSGTMSWCSTPAIREIAVCKICWGQHLGASWRSARDISEADKLCTILQYSPLQVGLNARPDLLLTSQSCPIVQVTTVFPCKPSLALLPRGRLWRLAFGKYQWHYPFEPRCFQTPEFWMLKLISTPEVLMSFDIHQKVVRNKTKNSLKVFIAHASAYDALQVGQNSGLDRYSER